ncbi:hypothetical protein MGMO_70c00060 [Methyloglobulus morosus KoM1]|uniref:Uncharacterized protein n=1 Tax=Methyloglobulus morosus KoM1 TaxID=1116472 RepID=V5DXR3_9GAMM|nr:hypothetical protein [Methyloglobulus morosus]ESS72111.1 hypothetical protein MGMO_70c00060 [Methyloglobulus morosus KoM1]
MKINPNTLAIPTIPPIHIGRRNAYHQAGLAVAVYLGNQQKNLPALHFQVAVRLPELKVGMGGRLTRTPGRYAARLEGGRLIPYLPYSYESATRLLSPLEKRQCQCAFEADVVNLLVGSLAEAKYVALRDGEVFNANLVYLGALKFYGGDQELKIIDGYMACLLPDNQAEQRKKLAELFLAAYSFINDRQNWQAIKALAEAIYNDPKEVFTCEEVIALVELGHSSTHVVSQNFSFDNAVERPMH